MIFGRSIYSEYGFLGWFLTFSFLLMFVLCGVMLYNHEKDINALREQLHMKYDKTDVEFLLNRMTMLEIKLRDIQTISHSVYDIVYEENRFSWIEGLTTEEIDSIRAIK